MSIAYMFEVVAVDEQARCMEVVYTAPGHATHHIGARLPFEGETLEQIVKMYSPVALWEEKLRNISPPVVGAVGTIEPDPVIDVVALTDAQPTSTGSQTL